MEALRDLKVVLIFYRIDLEDIREESVNWI